MAEAPEALTLAGAGVRLAVEVHEPAGARAALIVIHGLGDHAGRYARLGTALRDHGVATFAMDLRGHGRSGGQRGHTSRFAHFLDDVDTVRAHVHCRHPALPLFLLGQSMGGLVLLRYLQERASPRGAILCSPWLATAMPVPAWKRVLGTLTAVLLPRLPFSHGMHAEDLSRDPEVVARYRGDPLVHGRITPATFREASTAMRLAREHADRLDLPLLFLLGGADRVVDTRAARRFAESLHGADLTVILRADAYHELLNETDRDATFEQVADWLLQRL